MRSLKVSILLSFLILSNINLQELVAQNIYTQDNWKARDKWQQVPKILNTMGISSGDVVADIGCHEGYMTFKFLDKIGKSGKVYAVDVNRSRLNRLDDLLEKRGVDNVETIRGNYDNPNLPKQSLDYAFIMDAYHEMDDYMDILGHIKSALKSDGKLVILEPIAEEHRDYSREKQADKHDISMRYVVDDLEKAGFKVLLKRDRFINRAPKKKDHLWVIVAQAQPGL